MTAYPKKYSKEDFIDFLLENNINDNIVNKFNELPESIKKNGNTYDLYINSIRYNNENTHYEFEINYYSEELIEYLFSSKVFKDVGQSINYILCELKNANCLY
jgi:hypothetical protein